MVVAHGTTAGSAAAVRTGGGGVGGADQSVVGWEQEVLCAEV